MSMKPIAAPQRILVVRLDRLGDLVLSLPAVEALKAAFPQSYLAMLVQKPWAEVLVGHPAVDHVYAYDKAGEHRTWRGTWRFARRLRGEHFDTAVVLHPSNRSHGMVFLAGIPTRVGYDRKLSGLLTHRFPHHKQHGQQHESAYTLELLQVLGLSPPPSVRPPRLAVDPQARMAVLQRLQAAGWSSGQPLIAVHPSASCPSKRWPTERFAAVCNQLIEKYHACVCLIAGPEDVPQARAVQQAMHQTPAVCNWAGQLAINETVALLAASTLLLSNDSGPVHLAAAVGTPVVVIFGRNNAGLSPRRWGPLGEGHIILHKEVGCAVCLAHHCQIQFRCLTELSVAEVAEACFSILMRR
jgi:heptosyltransferase-2